MTSAVATLVEKLIVENFVVVFSKSYCPFCIKAKDLLSSLKVNFKALELDQMGQEGADIQNYLAQKTGQRTVPNIFIQQKHIGGCDDLMKLNSSGKLAGMLKQ